MSDTKFVTLSDEQVKARKRRNIAIAAGLLVFIATVYAITVSRLHANNETRKAMEAAENTAAGVVAPSSDSTPSTLSLETVTAEAEGAR